MNFLSVGVDFSVGIGHYHKTTDKTLTIEIAVDIY